jgi:hypothetical protein
MIFYTMKITLMKNIENYFCKLYNNLIINKMVTRQKVIDNLMTKPIYFNKPIFKKKNGNLFHENKNFLEIYSILMGAFKKKDDFVWERGTKAIQLLESEKINFWGNITDDQYKKIINTEFYIKQSDLYKFVDSIIMPSLIILD